MHYQITISMREKCINILEHLFMFLGILKSIRMIETAWTLVVFDSLMPKDLVYRTRFSELPSCPKPRMELITY